MAETATYDIVVKGGDAGAAQFDRVAKSAAKLNDTSKTGTKIFADHGDALDKMARLLRGVSPELGKFAGSIDLAGKAAMSLTQGLGFGVGGLVIGGVLGAIALYTEYQASSAEKTRLATEAIAKQKESVEDLAKAYQALGQSALQSEAMALRKAAEDSSLTPDRRAWMTNRAASLQGQADAAYESDSWKRENDAAKSKINSALSTFDEPGKGGKAKNDDYFFESVKRREASDAQLADLQRQSIQAEMAEEQRASEERLRIAQSGIDAEYEASKIASEERIAQREREHEEYERLEKTAADNSQLRRQLASEAMNALGNNVSTALSKVAKGQKLATGAMLEGIGDQAITSGVFHMLAGAAKLAGMNPAGAAEIAAGGAMVAFGMGIAGAGSHMSGGSNTGRGGGAVQPSSMASRPAEPTRSMDAMPTGTTSTIIVQVNANVVDEHAGETIARSLESMSRRTGRKLNPNVIGAV